MSERAVTRGRAAFVIAALLLLSTLCSVSALAASRPIVYVSMGDSYTAGPLVPVPTGSPSDCGRSDHNYPTLLAAVIKARVFHDVSCSEADTTNFSEPQTAAFGGTNPPQFDALGVTTTLVTVGIGVNDIDGDAVVQNCLRPPPPVGHPCTSDYVHGGQDELSMRIRATAPKIAAALREIHRRAPAAHVLVVGYPALLPDTGNGCYPYFPILPEDVPYLRAKEKELNAMLARQARSNRATYVDWYTPSVGHDACQPPTVAWVNGAVIVPPSLPWHPNAYGLAGAASAALNVLRRR